MKSSKGFGVVSMANSSVMWWELMFWVESISGIISRRKYLLGQNLQSEELLLVFIVVR